MDDILSSLPTILIGYRSLALTRYLDLSATLALLLDYCDTFGSEYRHFWGGRPSILHLLFFLNRYFAILVQLFNTSTFFRSHVSKRFCQIALVGFLPWSGVISIFVVQAILCFRLHAMYSQSRRMLVFLVAFLSSTCAGTVTALAVQITRLHLFHKATNMPPKTQLNVCFVPANVQSFVFVAIPVILFDVVAFLLAANKAYKHFTAKIRVNFSVKDNVQVAAFVQPAWDGPRLLRILVRDSIIYFVMICTVYVINALIWRFQPTALSIVAAGWSLTLLSVAGNRMLLGLKEARDEEEIAQRDQDSTSTFQPGLEPDYAAVPLTPMSPSRHDNAGCPADTSHSRTRLLQIPVSHAMYNI